MTADPTLSATQSGVSVCRFNIAVNRRFKNANGEYDADFISCVAWRQTGEFISKHFTKGRMIGIVGSLQSRTYEKDGQTHYVTEVNVEEVHFAGDKGNTSSTAQPATDTSANIPSFTSGNIPMPAMNDEGDELPF